MRNTLRDLLDSNGIQHTEFAAGIGRTKSFVSRLLSGDSGASQETIEAVLAFLTQRLGRAVTYEEVFSSDAVTSDKATA